MDKKDERYLNVTLKNESDEKDDVIISFSGIFKMLKKYFLVWFVLAVVAGVLILSCSAVFTSDIHKNISALVSFSYDGIEKGLAPDGNVFDVNSIKTPTVIEAALTELGEPLDQLENIRQGIRIEGVIPSDAIDRITTYKSVYENTSSNGLSAAQAMLDVTYYPTQYKVYFNYANTGYSGSDAVQIFNTMLECYRDYFFQTYGYNKAFGSAVNALDYNDYDYAEAVDVFDTTLSTLKKYVDSLAAEDITRFRSSVTGYTFADLSDAVNTLRTMDLDILSSYITVNNVTKDKDRLVNYYNYRIESLTRSKTIAEETLATITDTINNYEKDVVMIFGNGTDTTDTQYSQASQEYDKLIQMKIDSQTELSTANQQISYYNQRINALKGKNTASDASIERVEADLSVLNEKVNNLIENVNQTADEYYSTVSFANAYSILVPSSSSSLGTVKHVIDDSMKSIIIVEALLIVIYIGVAFVMAIITENKKKNTISSAADDESGDADENKVDNNESKKKNK